MLTLPSSLTLLRMRLMLLGWSLNRLRCPPILLSLRLILRFSLNPPRSLSRTLLVRLLLRPPLTPLRTPLTLFRSLPTPRLRPRFLLPTSTLTLRRQLLILPRSVAPAFPPMLPNSPLTSPRLRLMLMRSPSLVNLLLRTPKALLRTPPMRLSLLTLKLHRRPLLPTSSLSLRARF